MSGHLKYKKLDKETADWLVSKQNKAIYPDACVQFGPEEVFLPEFYAETASFIENLEVRDDDLWICSFIKAGTD